MPTLQRRAFLAATAGTLLAGCTGSTQPAGTPTGGGGGTPRSPTGGPPTAAEQLPLPIPPGQLRDNARSGGPQKDGIPSIDRPRFLAPGDVDYLRDGDPVFGVARNGAAKAYPQKILVHHEIVNDTLGDLPVSVTYCPLTGTAQGFERGDTTFGVSGRLLNDNLVMYDRDTETWWPQMLATAIPGPWNGDPPIRSLREFRVVWTTWGRWRTLHPDTAVLSTDTGYSRNYGADPYGSYNPLGGYYTDRTLLIPPLHEDDRFERKTVVMGARTPDGAVAFLKDALRSNGVRTGSLAGDPVVAVYDPRYDTAYVYRNPRDAAYEYTDGQIEGPTGSSHRPDRVPLDRVYTFDAMWFAWYGYYPGTAVYA